MPDPVQTTSGDANWRVIAQAIRVVSGREQVSVSEARASLRAEADAFGIPLVRPPEYLAAFDQPVEESTA